MASSAGLKSAATKFAHKGRRNNTPWSGGVQSRASISKKWKNSHAFAALKQAVSRLSEQRLLGGTQPVGPKVHRAVWVGRREAVGQHVFTMVLRHSASLEFSPFIFNFSAIFYQFSSHSVDSLTRPFSMTDQANQLHSGLVPNEHLGRLPTKYVPNSNLLLNVVRELLGSDFRIEVRNLFPNYIYNRTQHQLFRCAITSTISDRRKRSTWYVPPLCCRAATKPF